MRSIVAMLQARHHFFPRALPDLCFCLFVLVLRRQRRHLCRCSLYLGRRIETGSRSRCCLLFGRQWKAEYARALLGIVHKGGWQTEQGPRDDMDHQLASASRSQDIGRRSCRCPCSIEEWSEAPCITQMRWSQGLRNGSDVMREGAAAGTHRQRSMGTLRGFSRGRCSGRSLS